jgi:hypothetical protein
MDSVVNDSKKGKVQYDYPLQRSVDLDNQTGITSKGVIKEEVLVHKRPTEIREEVVFVPMQIPVSIQTEILTKHLSELEEESKYNAARTIDRKFIDQEVKRRPSAHEDRIINQLEIEKKLVNKDPEKRFISGDFQRQPDRRGTGNYSVKSNMDYKYVNENETSNLNIFEAEDEDVEDSNRGGILNFETLNPQTDKYGYLYTFNPAGDEVLSTVRGGDMIMTNRNQTNREIKTDNPATKIINFVAFARSVLDEINQARINPTKYATRLEALMKESFDHFNDTTFYYDNYALKLKEGKPAFLEAVKYLKNLRPLPSFRTANGVRKSAEDLLSSAQLHDGERTSMSKKLADINFRMNKYGAALGDLNEIIDYGGFTAELVAISFIICDGDPMRKERKNSIQSYL